MPLLECMSHPDIQSFEIHVHMIEFQLADRACSNSLLPELLPQLDWWHNSVVSSYYHVKQHTVTKATKMKC